PFYAVRCSMLNVDPLPDWRVCSRLLLLTPLPSEPPLSPVRVLSAWNPLPYSGAPYSKRAAKLIRRVLASVAELDVLPASSVSSAKTEFRSWLPPRSWLLQTLRLARLAPFPDR